MRPHNTKQQARALQSSAALFAECGGNLSPLFHRMLVCNTGWSVEPGDGCRGIPHPGAIRFDLPASLPTHPAPLLQPDHMHRRCNRDRKKGKPAACGIIPLFSAD
jgi:hypothetical protein